MTREEIEQYNSMVELFAEVDRRPKNVELCLTNSLSKSYDNKRN